jgi:hypothetical protein
MYFQWPIERRANLNKQRDNASIKHTRELSPALWALRELYSETMVENGHTVELP